MVIQLIWIIAIYGLAVAIVHGLYALRKLKGNSVQEHCIHYILVTSNHEGQVEWYVRALQLYGYLRGKIIYITVVDDASSDDTVRIIQRLEGLSGIYSSVVSGSLGRRDEISSYLSTEIHGEIIMVDLRISQEADQIPYVQG
ncbi:hypothetical protein J2T13_003596 [Paenibacillus sp. DS2015]|uniref:hypothetical protein n=1 Tax=Paenibacillus sp. DS2015 TaxID=3373917 RepID=UPI003D25F44C